MLHIALIGSGGIVSTHIEALLQFPELCKITAICDIFVEKAEKIRDKYALDCAVFASHNDMLQSDVVVEVMHICTPPFTHAQIAIDVMRAHKHVVLEKPMAPTLAECDAMMQVEREMGVTLACIAQNRFTRETYKLKQLLDSKVAGQTKAVHVNSYWWRGHNYYDLWWRGTWEKEGGGCTLNHAIHHIDMLNWMQGAMPTSVTALLANVSHDNAEVEDLSMAMLTYADKTVAQVTASVVHHGEEQNLIFQCERAKLALPWHCAAMKQKENGFPEHDHETEAEMNQAYSNLPDLPYEGHTAQIHNILCALTDGNAPLVTSQDGRNTVELVTAIYKAGFAKRTIELPITQDDPYYTQEGKRAQVKNFYEKGASIENFINDDISVGKLR